MKTKVLTDKEVPVKVADIRVYHDNKNRLWYSAEDVSRKLRLVHLWLRKQEFYYKVHWSTVNKLLKGLGYDIVLTKGSFITEDIVMALSKKLHRNDIIKLVNRLRLKDFIIPNLNVISVVRKNIILFSRIKLAVISKIMKDALATISGIMILGVTKAVADIRRAVVSRSRDSPVSLISRLTKIGYNCKMVQFRIGVV